MRVREAPAEVPNRWPYFTISVAGVSWVAKAPALPGSRLRLVTEYGQAVRAAQDALGSTEGDAAALGALDEVAAAHGWVLLATWADPDLQLDARARWDAGAYEGIDAKDRAGLDAVQEISDHFGLGWSHVMAVVAEVLKICNPGTEPGSAEVAEAKVFSSPR